MTKMQLLSNDQQPREDRYRAGLRTARVGPLSGMRILYVDDERLLRNATNRLIRGAGATCLLAETHAQAAMLAESEPALSVAILDFHMPDGPVDGLLERLRATRPALPLIGTSGTDRQSAFRDRGVTWFLPKPWLLADLLYTATQVMAPNARFQTAVSPGSPD